MKSGFEVGAIVRLKSGGLKMTVTQSTGERCACCWFASDQEHRKSFPASALKYAGVRLTGDIFEKYESILKVCPAGSLSISVSKRTDPNQAYHFDRLKSGEALRNALNRSHGKRDATEYQVRIVDIGRKLLRGSGRITLPDTRSGSQKKSGRPR
jgi:uncharacterized protein YodC (DUF2158 family)